jgi:hypothetical protein
MVFAPTASSVTAAEKQERYGNWQEEPADSNDNTHNKDEKNEDDHPHNDHIYSIDDLM